jgi:mannose/cellobiose epimerase-like protein (N-acyl-D-glucosamine 2-epimerase family)
MQHYRSGRSGEPIVSMAGFMKRSMLTERYWTYRFRVIARQAYSYCEAGRLGWNRPWREATLWALE